MIECHKKREKQWQENNFNDITTLHMSQNVTDDEVYKF